MPPVPKLLEQLNPSDTLSGSELFYIRQGSGAFRDRKLLLSDLAEYVGVSTIAAVEAETARAELAEGTLTTNLANEVTRAENAEAAILGNNQNFSGIKSFAKNIGFASAAVGLDGGSTPSTGIGNGMDSMVYHILGAIYFIGGGLATAKPFIAFASNPLKKGMLFDSFPADYVIVEGDGTQYTWSHSSGIAFGSSAPLLMMVWDGTTFMIYEYGVGGASRRMVQTLTGAATNMLLSTPGALVATTAVTLYLGNPDINVGSGSAMEWTLTNISAASITLSGTFEVLTLATGAWNHVTTTYSTSAKIVGLYWDGTTWFVRVP